MPNASPWTPSRLFRPIRHPRIPLPRFQRLYSLQTSAFAGFPRSHNHNIPETAHTDETPSCQSSSRDHRINHASFGVAPSGSSASTLAWCTSRHDKTSCRPPLRQVVLLEAFCHDPASVRHSKRLPPRNASPPRFRDVRTARVSTRRQAVGCQLDQSNRAQTMPPRTTQPHKQASASACQPSGLPPRDGLLGFRPGWSAASSRVAGPTEQAACATSRRSSCRAPAVIRLRASMVRGCPLASAALGRGSAFLPQGLL